MEQKGRINRINLHVRFQTELMMGSTLEHRKSHK